MLVHLTTIVLQFVSTAVTIDAKSTGFRPVIISDPSVRTTKINDTLNFFLKTKCGILNDKNIFPKSTYPWAVSITVKGKNRQGAAIISPYHLLTAAHPFIVFKDSNTTLCFGIGYRSIKEIQEWSVMYGGLCIRGNFSTEISDQNCQIRSVVVDGAFLEHNCRLGHDWAIIELENPISFSTRVWPICLPRYNQPIDNVLLIFGWGRESVFVESSPRLRILPMKYDPLCYAPRSDKMPTKVDDYICATSFDKKDYSSARTCYGDSGAGVEQDDNNKAILVGITSFGTAGCPPNELARFTKVDKYLFQICQITGICYTIEYLL